MNEFPTINLVSVQDMINQVINKNESRILGNGFNTVKYYFRIGELKIANNGHVKPLKALYCDELARRPDSTHSFSLFSESIAILDLILRDFDIVLLDCVVDYLKELDPDLYLYLTNHYEIRELKFEGSVYYDSGLYLPRQISKRLALNKKIRFNTVDSDNGDDQVHVGNNIKALRLLEGLTQEQLARKADISVRTLGNIERAAKPASCLYSLEKIAQSLKVNTYRLFGKLT